MKSFDTHTVYNQTPEYDKINLFSTDRALKESLNAEGADWAQAELSAFGAELGTKEQFHQSDLANTFTPELKSFDHRGHRQDQIEFHPAYHHFMALSKRERIHCGAFDHLSSDDRVKKPGVGVVRAMKHYMMSQVEAGHICPITMTHAAIPTIMIDKALTKNILPKLLSPVYDPAFKPISEKSGITIGMGMTEKQGGSDVRTNSSLAEPVGKSGSGQTYLITGHKWFMSAPMCDAFLVLAQTDGGLSVFFVPRFCKDGSVNRLKFQRLKNKLGNKSNASSEVEFHEAEGYMIGDEGRGIANIMTMANYTRLDCALGSSGLMRQALSRAVHHAHHRTVFQKKLIDQPMMAAVLADMCLEVEAATLLSMRLAGAYEGMNAGNESDKAFARLLTPVTKYWVSKRGPGFGYEAMECLGGNGYIDDGIMARIYRELPVNSIWEGSGSVMCLDVMRVIAKEPDTLEAVISYLGQAKGNSKAYGKSLQDMTSTLQAGTITEQKGRWFCEKLATLTAAKLLMERAPTAIGEAYIATRLDPEGRSGAYGSLPDSVVPIRIIEQTVQF